MRDRLAGLVVRWAPVVVWMGVIFLFSSRVDLPHAPQPWSDSLLRKSAHVVEFGVLGLLLVRALGARSWRRGHLLAILVASLYAASDEVHQAFVAGRHGSLWDVLLDSGAAGVGSLASVRRAQATRGGQVARKGEDTPPPRV